MKYLMSCAAFIMIAACSVESNSGEITPNNDINLEASLPVWEGDFVWDLVDADSQLKFKAVHNSREVEGRFGHFDAVIRLNPDAPETGEIHAVIGLASVDAGDNDRNANLPGGEWFDIKKHPLATFKSSDIRAIGGGNYEAKGNLTLKGITQPVHLTFALTVDGEDATAMGGVTFSRRLFNVGSGPDFETEDWVKFPVEVMFELKAVR